MSLRKMCQPILTTSEYLGVTPAEFFDDGSDHPVEYKEVLDEIKLLSHENLKNVMAIVKALNHNQT